MMNNENGRSMVEMLGVLAIIGVLSVAGIAGYTMAMKKYRANEMLNAASQVVILAKAKAANGATVTNYTNTDASITSPISGATITVDDGSKDKPVVTFTGVGEACTQLEAAVNTEYFTVSCS